MGKSLNQFLGISDIDSTMSHEEKYTSVVNAIGLKTCIRYMPATKEKIAKAISNNDKNLNTISLSLWDSSHFMFKREFVRIGITVISLSDTVCTLKQAAKMWVEKEG